MQRYMNIYLYTLIAPYSAFGLEQVPGSSSDLSFWVAPAMALFKKESSRSLLSRSWSTNELEEGLTHLLTDGRLELPDDIAQLQDPGVMVAE